MTRSVQEQQRNQLDLLTRLLDRVGDQDVDVLFFEVNEPAFADIYDTSWALLEDGDYLTPRHHFGNPMYQLTPYGWLRALLLTGRLTSPATQQRAQQLVKALKSTVKGRHGDAFIDVRDLANELNLPPGWVYNALATGLLEELYPGRGYSVTSERGCSFRVPSTFGIAHAASI